jgi:hypothetical protein
VAGIFFREDAPQARFISWMAMERRSIPSAGDLCCGLCYGRTRFMKKGNARVPMRTASRHIGTMQATMARAVAAKPPPPWNLLIRPQSQQSTR